MLDFILEWAVELLLAGILVAGLAIGIVIAVRLRAVAYLFRQAGTTLLTRAQSIAHKTRISTDTGDPRRDRLRQIRDERIAEAQNGTRR